MRRNSGRSWKFKFAIVMLIIASIFFVSRIIVLGDPEEVVAYLWKQIGFIPVNILIVALLLDGIMSKKEREAILEKLDMLMGTFFTEIGNDLISEISKANKNKSKTKDLKSIKNWTDKDYENKLKELRDSPIDFEADVPLEDREKFLTSIHVSIEKNREFIINLINNPNLFEKDEFSALVLALLHLDEELSRRGDLSNIDDVDFNHLTGDIKRVYTHLVYEWIYYLKYLNQFYPYMISLAIRTNPFDSDADVHVTE